MPNLLKFNKVYFLLSLIIFVIEILIAQFAHDQLIRPYVGDLLVVILIYCSVKSFLNTPALATALSVLLFSFAVETLQYAYLVDRLGLQNSTIAKLIIGTSFEWVDLLTYTIGIVLVIYGERARELRLRRMAKKGVLAPQ